MKKRFTAIGSVALCLFISKAGDMATVNSVVNPRGKVFKLVPQENAP